MPDPLSISEARKRLPELAHRVARAPGLVQYIRHRDLDDDLALTTRRHIRYLETMVAELRKRVSGPFTLADSVVACGTDSEIEASIRDARSRDEVAGARRRAELDY